jgi:membrane protein YdbS with pleckstrin-like domain
MKNTDLYSKILRIILEILTIIFVVLKLTGYIDWSWWLVTLPFWGSAALGLFILLILFIYTFFEKILERKKQNNEGN